MKDFWQHCITNCKKELSAILFVSTLFIISLAAGISEGNPFAVWPHLIIFGLADAGLIFMLFQNYNKE